MRLQPEGMDYGCFDIDNGEEEMECEGEDGV